MLTATETKSFMEYLKVELEKPEVDTAADCASDYCGAESCGECDGESVCNDGQELELQPERRIHSIPGMIRTKRLQLGMDFDITPTWSAAPEKLELTGE